MATRSPVDVQEMPLLRTKLYTPSLRHDQVPRPYLREERIVRRKGRARVLPQVSRALMRLLFCVWLTVLALLAAGCRGLRPSISSEASPQLTAAVPVSSVASERQAPSAGQVPLPLSPKQRLRFDRILTEDGLSQVSVFSILQDNQGFMWFGTEHGLNRYDGYTFAVYKHDPEDPNSLSDSWISAMTVDPSGDLWIGTANAGLNRFDLEVSQITRYQNDPDDARTLSNDRVLAMLQDRAGDLWVGTEYGLNRFVRETETFYRYQHDPNDPSSLSGDSVRAIYKDRDGNLWIGSDGGLDRYDPGSGGFVHFQNDPNQSNSLSHNSVWAIQQDSEGALWVGTDDGLNVLLPGSERFTRYKMGTGGSPDLISNEIRTIFEDRSGVLWIGTNGGGLHVYDRKSEAFVTYAHDPLDPSSLSDNFIPSIFQDREEVLWVGTKSGGVNKLDRDRRVFAQYKNEPNNPNSLSDNWVRSFFEDPSGAIWIGTGGGGLNWFDPETGRFTQYRHDPDDPNTLSHDFLSETLQDSQGMLWIGTGSGLDRLDPATGEFAHYQHDPSDPASLSENNYVYAFLEDREGVLWIAAHGGGLNRFNAETNSFTHYLHDPNDPRSLIHNDIWEIVQRQDGMLWLGTGGGLDLFDPETERFTHYRNDPDNPSSLSFNFVGPILEDPNGVTWFGTVGGGLDRLDPKTGDFAHFREQDGLPSDMIMMFVQDEGGSFWLSTPDGLSRFDPRTETFRNYDRTDGLPFMGFNGGALMRSSSGRLYAGGAEGFIAFDPDQVRDNPYIPPIAITTIAQGGKEILVEKVTGDLDQITLEWPDNTFEVEYAALSYSNPDANQYAYYLEGLEETWNEVGTRRYARYTNLAGGMYILRVRGSNDDGMWNETGAAVRVTVVPPFWATWRFRGGVLLILVAGAYGGYRLRVRSVEARNRDLTAQIEQRTAELMQAEETLRQGEMEEAVAAERSRLARELHDAVTQTLFSASLIAETLPRSWARDQEKGRRLLQELRQLSRGALAEMRTLLLELRPAALVETSLSDLLHQLAEAASGRGGVPVNVIVEGACALSPEVHIALYRIAQEALNNAIKHARAGQVTVHLSCSTFSSAETEGTQRKQVELVVRDDGRGFDPAQVPPDHLGLGIMRERAEAIGATLEIDSGPEHGPGTQIRATWKALDEDGG
jgi:ligand-binding sensor domain-containing protein/signal transduction histidine kinase